MKLKKTNQLNNNCEEYIDMFRKQILNLSVVKDQYFTTQELYEKRLSYLEGRVQTYKKNMKF